MNKNDKIFFIIILIGIGLIIISFMIIFSEINSAKGFCNSIDRDYSFFPDLKHRCDNLSISQSYSQLRGKHWDFYYNITLP